MLYICLRNNSNDKKFFQIICQKVLDFEYLCEIISNDDVFIFNSLKNKLKTIFQIQVMKILNEIWLKSFKSNSIIFNNPFLLNFFQKHCLIMNSFLNNDKNVENQNKSNYIFYLFFYYQKF